MSAKLTKPGAMSEGRSFVVFLQRQAIKGGTAGLRHRAILSRVCAAKRSAGNGRSDERARSAQTPTRSRRSEWGGRKAYGCPANCFRWKAQPCVGADACIGPSAGLADNCRFRITARLRVPCRAGDFARRGALRHRRVCGTMQASSPTDAGQGPAGVCRIPVGQSGNAPLRPRCGHLPLQGRLCKRFSPKRLPCKGSCRRQPTEGCCALSCQYLSGPCGIAGFAGRCKHRLLRTRGRALPGFEGYLWVKAAMHPSACVAGTSPYRGGFWRAAFPVGR